MTEDPSAKKPSVPERVKTYFTELQLEWKKITTPTRKELQQSTIVVFVFTMLIMAIITLLDIVIGIVFARLILPS